MYVIAGANGQTGSVVATTLLNQGKPVRVILRRAEQGSAWLARGAEVCVADLTDEAALFDAFSDAEAAYLINPPAYQADDLMAQAKKVHRAMINAAERAANFIENWAWFLDDAVATVHLPSMFQPLDHALPMVSARDIGRTAAEMLDESNTGIVELHGPQAYSPHDAAAEIERIVGWPVEATVVPRNDWPANFRAIGYSQSATEAFCDMFDGFNNGRVAFEGTHQTRHGSVSQEEVFRHLLAAKGSGPCAIESPSKPPLATDSRGSLAACQSSTESVDDCV